MQERTLAIALANRVKLERVAHALDPKNNAAVLLRTSALIVQKARRAFLSMEPGTLG